VAAYGLDDAKRIEAGRNRRPVVDCTERLCDPAERLRLAERLGADDLTADEPRDEEPLRLDECDNVRPDAYRGRCERRLVLDPAVDAEQLRVLAADAKHEGAVVERDLEVPIGDAAAEHFDLRAGTRPDPLHDLLDPHGRAMVVARQRETVSSGRALTRLG
jgi:hypothetical protein